MAKYGLMHRTADFIARSASSRDHNHRYLLRVITLIQDLDKIQENNPSVTILIWNADGIWVTHRGVRLFMLLPRKGEIRVLYSRDLIADVCQLHSILQAAEEAETVTQKDGTQDYFLWSLPADQFSLITDYLADLPHPQIDQASASHPRHFPGEVRQVALDMFERDGRWCNGVSGHRSRHKVAEDERTEFDHILPFARGGSRSALNIQVLCVECNRLKRASAL